MTAEAAYRTLQLPFGSSVEEAKRSWRRLVRVHHPDMGGDAASFLLIQEAYEFVSNPRNAHLLQERPATSNFETMVEKLRQQRAEAAAKMQQGHAAAAKARAEAEKRRKAAQNFRASGDYLPPSGYKTRYAHDAYLRAEQLKAQMEDLLNALYDVEA